MPYLTVPCGAMGGFFGMAGAVLLILPLCLWLPAPPRDPLAETASRATPESLSPVQRFAEKLGVRRAPNKEYAILALLALFIYEIGQGAVQVFLEQFGFRTGMEEFRIGQVLCIAGFLGLSGGVVAAWLADRFGNLRPALIGIALNVTVALALWTRPVAFALLYLAWAASFYFVVPNILGIMSELDTKGRWRRMQYGGLCCTRARYRRVYRCQYRLQWTGGIAPACGHHQHRVASLYLGPLLREAAPQ